MDITKYGDFWDTTQQKIDQMRTNSFNHLYIQKLKSAITFFPHIKRKRFLTVEYIYGEEISRKNGGQRIIVPGGIYLKASKVGRINDFHDFSNTLYRDVLYAFNIKRRNERDYEEIIRVDSDLFKLSYFIPIET
ncbi:hypothetical protein [Salmonella enterica]|uniref:GyrI-like small molecule binding domain-containing protein n=1 Tax=Salmonella enterica subsp. salamae serovar 55:k:z39 str. 1315K TaxID=1243602 RepID=A0A6C7CC09_SALER|nr:hypothetical protein [Salmonella enterica]ECC1658250.1 GyrI-like domain-containing protein [Salmonella enterica subsp. salamae]ASG90670.1 hypothetical protein LFZ47_24785 [Salmonella enterica subsp. salamae serovar 55:k:z39 str. 1315K]ECC1695091.1 GyrI-like domain-containing protein [Salmonella enterica subsp. salamae]ECD9416448.1 GyrI-like domain-containing protein [Salmonella enterica subsp. salamae]ECF5933342.1 GyrI-like domain-containing protein [Salmonella enterica subsp. salamae]